MSDRRLSAFTIFVNNIPYASVIALGTVLLYLGPEVLRWKLFSAVVYFLYGIAGIFVIILGLCPYCKCYGTNSCPSGYGNLAAKLRGRQEHSGEVFADVFETWVPLIMPLWFIPPILGVTYLVIRFSWLYLALFLFFLVVGFVILPTLSTGHGCAKCPQRNNCPWMKKRMKRETT